MKRNFFLLFLPFSGIIFFNATAQKTDTIQNTKKEKIKKGWSVGAVPAIAFDSDIGLKLGGVINFFDYGDGTVYPNYKHSLYFEYSFTTKGSRIAQFIYDSKYLIPKVRFSAEASYLTERALDFYGFNGYESVYNHDFEDDKLADTIYKSRLYYRQERQLMRFRTDFQGRFLIDHARWLAGACFYNIATDTIDVDRLNKGKSGDDLLPYTSGGLYGDYVNAGLIPEDQKNGGTTTLLKGGVIYDTRDNEPNPMHGMWSEVVLFWAPDFLCSNNYGYAKISLIHRQYFSLVPDQLSFVYRLVYQGKLWGTMPYYMLPFIHNGGNTVDRDGLGGSKTMRGILRDRVVGEDYAFGNFELRWKFIRTILFKQNVYFALSAFTDAGMVTRKYQIDESKIVGDVAEMFSNEEEKPHISYGGGLHIAINQNFVLASDYGIAADKRDGSRGLYINLNWLF